MKIGINKLNFIIPDNPFGTIPKRLDLLTKEIESLEKKAGTGSDKSKEAYSIVHSAIENQEYLSGIINSPIRVRALSNLLQSEVKDKIQLSADVFRRIDALRPNPSSVLIQNVYQYYLSMYDQLSYRVEVANWLKKSMDIRGTLTDSHNHILDENGPKWLAQQCISNNREFNNQIIHLDLENYESGGFLTAAKNIYFVEQLLAIPANEPDPLLLEVQKKDVYESRYDEHFLLGHKVLQILIDRAPLSGIDDSWRNVIMAIAGDPRVPPSNPRYLKWWSRLDPSLNKKVKGWLSGWDLRLFLEALEDFSLQPGKEELKRMFPSRKAFLEGLFKKGLITHTRLYLSYETEYFIKRNYKPEHIPSYSMIIDDRDKSVIHVEMEGAHLIEGSHSCYLWIYKKLDSSAIVFDYTKNKVRYSALTRSLSKQMQKKGTPHQANITHNPINFSWQHSAIEKLNEIGVNITALDVLPDGDYLQYKRKYGVK